MKRRNFFSAAVACLLAPMALLRPKRPEVSIGIPELGNIYLGPDARVESWSIDIGEDYTACTVKWIVGSRVLPPSPTSRNFTISNLTTGSHSPKLITDRSRSITR